MVVYSCTAIDLLAHICLVEEPGIATDEICGERRVGGARIILKLVIINCYIGLGVVFAADVRLTLVLVLLIVFLKHQTLAVVLDEAGVVGKAVERLPVLLLAVSYVR